jgi:hypothetical protein
VTAEEEDALIGVPAVKLVNSASVRTSGVTYISVSLYAYPPIRNGVHVIGYGLTKDSRSDDCDFVAFIYEPRHNSVLYCSDLDTCRKCVYSE